MNDNQLNIPSLQHRIANLRDTKSYELLYKHYYRPLINFSETIVKTREAAEEVYSDVLLKIWRMETGLGEIRDLNVYLYKSIRNASLNYKAKYQKPFIVSLESAHTEKAAAETILDNIIHGELSQQLALIVRNLPEKCQLVYRLIKECGLTYKEVAEVMEISVNTVEGHMTTALRKITASLRPFIKSE